MLMYDMIISTLPFSPFIDEALPFFFFIKDFLRSF